MGGWPLLEDGSTPQCAVSWVEAAGCTGALQVASLLAFRSNLAALGPSHMVKTVKFSGFTQ